jgi:hypothetical protein
MKKTKEQEFNPNPPLSNTEKKFVIYLNKEDNKMFMTSGGEYRSDWYNVVFQSDDMDEVSDFYMKLVYDSNKPF